MSESGGSILFKKAYAQGKMLDHSGWASVLPRGITPSDVDWFVHNRTTKRFLFVELKFLGPNAQIYWPGLSPGQKESFVELIRGTDNAYALCGHNVEAHEEREIDTLADVAQFQVAFWHRDELMISPVYHGNKWKSFFLMWFNEPDALKSKLLMTKAA